MTSSDRCPDCGVSLEPVKFGMNDAWKPYVKTSERREGLLGSLGMNETKGSRDGHVSRMWSSAVSR